uniref:ATP synthase subunit a n=1 Tax=Physarum polycephalum TaxID=5791 RepID=F2Y9S7_PHYPO|nr:ATP synthase subunit 6 [Physarum polycephalum]|eukprot:Phypoly_transcript_00920.p2 GENE.Phypoly_transcript_00920~~Phypoly_transcript_00920.p2  ORF type:complete len:247 (-),score=-25.13 Phypoly_transcript_00920:1686-2426(-)
MNLYNPFEQFEIILISKLKLFGFDISLTNLTVVVLSTAFIIFTLNYILDKGYNYIPHNWQIVMEAMYQFVFSIVSEQAGRKGIKYLPHLATIFFIILFYNLSGLAPFSFTASSHLVITFGLALSYFIAWVIIGIKELGPKFVYVFCPKNMPLWLLPLLICVEFLSFFLRPISLGLRLFANMLAGHILLHILAGGCVYLLTKLFILAIPAFAIIGAIGILELGIGFLQAYIFVILLAIYLKDSLYSH